MKSSIRKEKVICIVCPIGCTIEVTLQNDEIIDVKDHLCERGRVYTIEEITAPKRVLTTTVNVRKGDIFFLPVKTATAIPKDLIFPCMEILKEVIVDPPIHIGDHVVKDVLGKGIDVVATRSIKEKKIQNTR